MGRTDRVMFCLIGYFSINTVSTCLRIERNDVGVEVNPFGTGNPFLGTKLLGFSVGRGSGALKGLMWMLLNVGIIPDTCQDYLFFVLSYNDNVLLF